MAAQHAAKPRAVPLMRYFITKFGCIKKSTSLNTLLFDPTPQNVKYNI